MTDKKITALDAITSASATDLLPIIQNVATTPVTRKSTLTQIKNYLYSFLTTAGDIIYATSASTPARIPIGTTKQILEVSASGSPAWATEPRFTILTTPLTSTSFDGDSFSDTAKTLIDLSAVFGVPAGVKAIYVKVGCRDSGSYGTRAFVILGPNATAGAGMVCEPSGKVNDTWEQEQMIIPCDTNGDIYYEIDATGAGTFDLTLAIWGYWA